MIFYFANIYFLPCNFTVKYKTHVDCCVNIVDLAYPNTIELTVFLIQFELDWSKSVIKREQITRKKTGSHIVMCSIKLLIDKLSIDMLCKLTCRTQYNCEHEFNRYTNDDVACDNRGFNAFCCNFFCISFGWCSWCQFHQNPRWKWRIWFWVRQHILNSHCSIYFININHSLKNPDQRCSGL